MPAIRTVKNVLTVGVTLAALTAASLPADAGDGGAIAAGILGGTALGFLAGTAVASPPPPPPPPVYYAPVYARRRPRPRVAGFNRRRSGRAMPMSFSGCASAVDPLLIG